MKSTTESSSSKPTGDSFEEKTAAAVLEMVDKAAGLLREGVMGGAHVTAEARQRVQKEAHTLLHNAVSLLEKAATSATSTLHTAIDKTLGGQQKP